MPKKEQIDKLTSLFLILEYFNEIRFWYLFVDKLITILNSFDVHAIAL